MPELPDVEVYRRYLSATALHRRIEHVSVRDERVLRGTTPSGLGRLMHNCALTGTDRHGKWLFSPLDCGRVLVFHFGMSGRLHAHDRTTEEAEHTQIRWDFHDGRCLDYVSVRKLGIVKLADRVEDVVAEEHLGPDALKISRDLFRRRIGGRRGTIKGALTNQSALAGLGNVYADEVLFQARVHPRSPAARLSDERLRRLHRCMVRVLAAVIAAQADITRLPDGYLVSHRNEGEPCPRCGGEVQPIEVGGRRGYYCPQCQHW